MNHSPIETKYGSPADAKTRCGEAAASSPQSLIPCSLNPSFQAFQAFSTPFPLPFALDCAPLRWKKISRSAPPTRHPPSYPPALPPQSENSPRFFTFFRPFSAQKYFPPPPPRLVRAGQNRTADQQNRTKNRRRKRTARKSAAFNWSLDCPSKRLRGRSEAPSKSRHRRHIADRRRPIQANVHAGHRRLVKPPSLREDLDAKVAVRSRE